MISHDFKNKTEAKKYIINRINNFKKECLKQLLFLDTNQKIEAQYSCGININEEK